VQSLKLKRGLTPKRGKGRKEGPNEKLVGLAVIGTVVMLLVALFVVYLRPPGKKELSFAVTDAASLSTGVDVRVAGIVVGKVTDVSIKPDHVLVKAKIDKSTFVGDRSTVDVRMLTPVGGYAITLIPSGTHESSATIPVDRVTVPYSIGDVIQAVPDTTDEVDTTRWHSNIKQVADAFGSNTTSLRSIVDGLDSVSEVFAKQRTQVHQITRLAADYLNTFNTNRDFVFDLVRKIDTVVTTYHINSAGFNYAYYLFSSVLYRVGPSIRLYLVNSDQLAPQIHSIIADMRKIVSEFEPTITGLLALKDKLMAGLTPENLRQLKNGQLSLGGLCIPVRGRKC
jgi:phospholipid/cholesterol/gamma-HCH transport system substrate-binding protein